MNKLFTKIAGLSLGLAMAIGVGVAVGSKEAKVASAAGTTNFTTTSSGGFSNNAKTDGGVTVTFGGSPSWQAAHVRVYAGATISFTSSSENITSIVVSHTSTGSYPISWSSNPSGISSATWTGSSSSVTLTNTSSKQVRITSIAVTTVASKTLSGIGVSTAPTKTTYLVGETFDPTGLVISRTWSSGNPDTYAYAGHTTEFTFSPTTSTALTTSNTSVTITYGGKSTTQAITVNAPKTPASVSSAGQTITFEAGDKFEYGGTLTATYTDSTSGGVTPTSFKIGNAGINPTSAGTAIVPGTTALSSDDHNGKTVYVLYTENNTTVYTSYVITVNKISKITLDPTATSSFPYQGITLTVTDGTLTNGSDYRVYKNQTMTITSTVGDMAKIEFTYSSASYDGGGWSSAYTPNADTWTSPTANGEQARITKIIVTLASTDPLVELDVSSATSVSMLKGDSNTSIKVHVANITTKTWTYTFDEDEEEGISASSYINVSAGAAVSDVHTLTITTKAVGSTVLHISVSGTACVTTIPVTVAAKPASMMVTESDHETQITTLELQSNGSTKQVYWIGEDTDGNAYSIAAAQVNGEVISGSSVTISSGAGTVITPQSAGTSVIRYSLKVLSSVYADITVNVVDDHNETVNSITFNSNLTATQGDPVDTSEVFATKTANTHFGSTTTIADSELLFSYENDRSNGEAIGVFSYDFSHGTTVDSTHKTQTVYVFTSFDSTYAGSFSITVEQKNDPLTAITITNVTENAVDIARGSTFQLEIAYTPTNPTDGKEVNYRIDDYDAGVSISVNSSGLISVSASSGLGEALIIVESAHDDSIYDYAYVTVTLESMTYTVSEAASYTKITSTSELVTGDYLIVYEDGDASIVMDGGAATIDAVASKITGVSVSNSTIAGSDTLNAATFHYDATATTLYSSSGKYMGKTADSNGIDTNASTQYTNTITFDSGNALIKGSGNAILRYNATDARFRYYKSTSYTNQQPVSLFLKSGGESTKNVDTTLFNAVHNNFGEGATYEWDASCASFDSESWKDACTALKGITGYSTYKLNRAVGNIAGNEIEQFIAKYDIIIGKTSTDYDFLGRFSSGGINYNTRIDVNPIQLSAKNTSTVIIIVVISSISIAAVGGYFLFRKKKEN